MSSNWGVHLHLADVISPSADIPIQSNSIEIIIWNRCIKLEKYYYNIVAQNCPFLFEFLNANIFFVLNKIYTCYW